jgi:hypothetical protein
LHGGRVAYLMAAASNDFSRITGMAAAAFASGARATPFNAPQISVRSKAFWRD